MTDICNPASNPVDSRVVINASPKEAMSFITQLATNDEARKRFEENPEQMLNEHNIIVPLGVITGKITLPCKEEIQDMISKVALGENISVRTDVNAAAAFIVFIVWIAFAKKASVSTKA